MGEGGKAIDGFILKVLEVLLERVRDGVSYGNWWTPHKPCSASSMTLRCILIHCAHYTQSMYIRQSTTLLLCFIRVAGSESQQTPRSGHPASLEIHTQR